MRNCRVIQDGARGGALNMAIDEALLRQANLEPGPHTTLRLYRWEHPTVSLGYAQKVETSIDPHYCAAQGIGVVRRPTGGRAVLHSEELTYAVASNDPLLFAGGIHATYLAIARVLHQALCSIGCPADISPGTPWSEAARQQAQSSIPRRCPRSALRTSSGRGASSAS